MQSRRWRVYCSPPDLADSLRGHKERITPLRFFFYLYLSSPPPPPNRPFFCSRFACRSTHVHTRPRLIAHAMLAESVIGHSPRALFLLSLRLFSAPRRSSKRSSKRVLSIDRCTLSIIIQEKSLPLSSNLPSIFLPVRMPFNMPAVLGFSFSLSPILSPYSPLSLFPPPRPLPTRVFSPSFLPPPSPRSHPLSRSTRPVHVNGGDRRLFVRFRAASRRTGLPRERETRRVKSAAPSPRRSRTVVT